MIVFSYYFIFVSFSLRFFFYYLNFQIFLSFKRTSTTCHHCFLISNFSFSILETGNSIHSAVLHSIMKKKIFKEGHNEKKKKKRHLKLKNLIQIINNGLETIYLIYIFNFNNFACSTLDICKRSFIGRRNGEFFL